MKYSHTLLYGYPWYYKFGFKFISKIYDDVVNYNIELYNKLTCKDIPRKYIRYEIDDNKRISEYFKLLIQNDREYFLEIYMKVFDELGFIPFSGESNEMKLILSSEIKTYKKIS